MSPQRSMEGIHATIGCRPEPVLQPPLMLPEQAAEAVHEGGRRAGFPALHHRNFRRFVVVQGVSLIGFWMQSVAQGWLVFRISGSALTLGVVSFAGTFPILCLAPVAGVIIDQVNRRQLLLVTQTLLTLLALALGVVVFTGIVTVPIVVALAAGVGVVCAFDVPARQSFLVEMSSPADLPSAIALNASIFSAARVIGPAVAGTLVTAV